MAIKHINWLVNFGLLGFPIAVTLGTLIGLQEHRDRTGGKPLFTAGPGEGSGSGSGGSGSGSAPKTTAISHHIYCNKSLGVTPPTQGQQYTFNPNQWGWTEGTSGGLCLNLTTFDNETYATDYTSPVFSVTWEYPQGPETQPVHAFPNVELSSTKVLPVALSSLSKFEVDLSWSYGIGNDSATSTVDAVMTANSVNANVAFDLFLDSSKSGSTNSSSATYEVMVWLADFGTATQPIGFSEGIVTTAAINGTSFNLYYGQNSNNQNVLTWIAENTTTTLVGDLKILIDTLTAMGKTGYPSTTDYLGYVSFGTEAYYSTTFTTFTVPELSINLEKN